MANGDAAAAAGLDVVASSADYRIMYDEANKTRDYVVDGTDWVDYTPTLTNLDAVTFARWRQVGGRIEVHVQAVSPTVGATPTLTLPVNANTSTVMLLPGAATFHDDSEGIEYLGVIRLESATVVGPYCVNLVGGGTGYAAAADVAASAPFTWDTGDILDMQFSYEPAA